MKRLTSRCTGGLTANHATLSGRPTPARSTEAAPRAARRRPARFRRPLAAGIAALLAIAVFAPRAANATPYVVTLRNRAATWLRWAAVPSI